MTMYTLFLYLLFGLCACQNITWTIPVENWETIVAGSNIINFAFGVQSIDTITWGTERGIFLGGENISIDLEFHDNQAQTAVALALLIDFSTRGFTFTTGNPLSDVSLVTGQAAAVYGVAQLSGTAITANLSDKKLYPFFSRTTAPTTFLTNGIIATILSFIDQGLIGWDTVALLISAEGYGISLANGFIERIHDTPIKLATYQQFLIGTTDLSVEMREIENSGARVLVVFAVSEIQTVLTALDDVGLLDDNHVVFTGPSTSGTTAPYTFPNGTVNYDSVERLRGVISTQLFFPRSGAIYEEFLARWQANDPAVVAGTGPGTIPSLYPSIQYDVGTTTALAVSEAYKKGFTPNSLPTAAEWSQIIRSLEFEGVTGPVRFDENGDRFIIVGMFNFQPEKLAWVNFATWTDEGGLVFVEDNPIIWHDNTTAIPDLDIRDPFNYWSCHSKEKRRDGTGKTISIQSPDGSDVDDIDIDYYCDSFIDCKNFSDESYDCETNYTVLFIVFGIITIVLILVALVLLIITIIFGIALKYRRLRTASPQFLVLLLISIVIGYCSIFAWFGKPHPVSCGFQPWLLGLPAISMIGSLSVKTFRIYRIFKYPLRVTKITNFEVFVYWTIVMIPAVVILTIWTIVSTPTASLVERDGMDHYICNTGGFTGEPGGLIFFFIFVAYSAFVLLLGCVVSFLARNTPSVYNETKLLTISIYNLGFLSAVIIPVFLVVQPYNPFVAWILRTCAILYAFTATMILQFFPIVFGIFCLDKGKNKPMPKMLISTTSVSPTKTT